MALGDNPRSSSRSRKLSTVAATLFVSPGHSNHSLIEGFSASEREVEVETVSIDAFLAQRGIASIHFAKIDIEGAESLALAGMSETIRQSPARRPFPVPPDCIRAAGRRRGDH
jgi:FkbM family methyltransferase